MGREGCPNLKAYTMIGSSWDGSTDSTAKVNLCGATEQFNLSETMRVCSFEGEDFEACARYIAALNGVDPSVIAEIDLNATVV